MQKAGHHTEQGSNVVSIEFRGKPPVVRIHLLGTLQAISYLGEVVVPRDEAAPYIAKLLSLEPTFTVKEFSKVYPFKCDEDRQRYMRGLELAGVPIA